MCTGAAQSLILASVLPWSERTSVGSQVLLQGLGKGITSAPLHWVNLKTDLVSGCFRVGVVPELPVSGVALLLGNGIAGVKVIPVLEVIDGPPTGAEGDKLSNAFPHVFPACVVTRTQARRLGEVVDLAGSVFERTEVPCDVTSRDKARAADKAGLSVLLSAIYDKVCEAQKADDSLAKCFKAVISP